MAEPATCSADKPAVIELKNVSKSFGEVRSLSGVNFKVNPREIVGLLGDNGRDGVPHARPWRRGIFPWASDGRLVSRARPRPRHRDSLPGASPLREAADLAQHVHGAGTQTRLGLLDVGRMRAEAARLMSEHMGFTSAAVHPNNVVATMSGGEKQGVAITRALYFEAELVILDEPTMGLSLSETKKTLDFVRNIKTAGKSAIFIDHNIFNVYPVVDRLYVLDRGKVAGVYNRSEITIDALVERLYHVARTGRLE
jgi:simple sugar transport system ATP-binding protein